LSGAEVELDAHHDHAGRQLSVLLSAALTAAQTAAQLRADRARAAEQQTREQQRQAETAGREAARRAEQAERAATEAQRRQFAMTPASTWLRDAPESAAAAWAAADVLRRSDPAAARHAEAWETIFEREGVDVNNVRASATTGAAQVTSPEGPGAEADAASQTVAGQSVAAGEADREAAAANGSAYGDGALTARLGGAMSTKTNSEIEAAAESRGQVGDEHVLTALQENAREHAQVLEP
jgi:hypothetical protein